jgi:hypothetical protein
MAEVGPAVDRVLGHAQFTRLDDPGVGKDMLKVSQQGDQRVCELIAHNSARHIFFNIYT